VAGLWHDLGKYNPAFQQYLIVLGRLIHPQVRHARDSFQKNSERHSRKHLRELKPCKKLTYHLSRSNCPTLPEIFGQMFGMYEVNGYPLSIENRCGMAYI
jgi:hypothetical protein